MQARIPIPGPCGVSGPFEAAHIGRTKLIHSSNRKYPAQVSGDNTRQECIACANTNAANTNSLPSSGTGHQQQETIFRSVPSRQIPENIQAHAKAKPSFEGRQPSQEEETEAEVQDLPQDDFWQSLSFVPTRK